MITLMGPDPALVLEIEERAFRAWPAAEVAERDGWRLRFNSGVTGRANSVWAGADPGACPLPEKLEYVEAAYAQRALPPKFQMRKVAIEPGLDDALTERGYAPAEAATCVALSTTSWVLSRLGGADHPVQLSEQLSETWFAGYAATEAYPQEQMAIRRGILERISVQTGFALVEQDGQPASVALGVRDGDWLGIFCVATRPEFRRRGLARATLRALLQWGAEYGATRSYLQVMENNVPARRLYGEAGYAVLYHYYYRTLVVG